MNFIQTILLIAGIIIIAGIVSFAIVFIVEAKKAPVIDPENFKKGNKDE